MAKKSINYYITAFPVNRKLQESLGIYDSYKDEKGNCKSQSVGKILSALMQDGCVYTHTYFDSDKNMMTIHCSARQ
jgi:hypothetical protein